VVRSDTWPHDVEALARLAHALWFDESVLLGRAEAARRTRPRHDGGDRRPCHRPRLPVRSVDPPPARAPRRGEDCHGEDAPAKGCPSGRPEEEERVTSSQEVTIHGKRLTLSNLDKVFYPKAGFTKAQVIDFYLRIAPVLLPHLRDRPLTLKRYPNGVDGESFYEKNCPAHRLPG